MTVAGADEPQGPGWWLASDGKYYPPSAAPGGATSAGAPKKKVVKKKAAASKAGPAKKKVVKKKAASPRAAKPAAANPDITAKRPGQMKFTAKAPGTDQIAARRIQAKEQMVLLADARQQAALRLLTNLGGDDEPALVGVGGRSLDARSERSPVVTPEPAAAPEPVTPAEPTRPEPTAEAPVEAAPAVARATPVEAPPAAPSAAPAAPTPAAPTPAPTVPAGDAGVVSPPPPVTPRAPAQAPPPPAPTAGAAPPPAPPPVVPPPIPTAPPVAPPVVAPPRAGGLGTDVPFMEVKGSALGTDIDRIGEKILIFADRVELRDRNNTTRQTIPYDELAGVEVQKKIMGPTLIVTSAGGATMTAKALRPELATGAKAMIEKHAERYRRGESTAARVTAEPTPETPPMPDAASVPAAVMPSAPAEAVLDAPQTPPAGRTHKAVLLAMLDELHSAGILSDDEVEMKRSIIELSDRG